MQLPINPQSSITLNKVVSLQVQKGRSTINLVSSISKSYPQTYFAGVGSEEATPSGANRTVWEALRMVTLTTSPRGNEGGKKQLLYHRAISFCSLLQLPGAIDFPFEISLDTFPFSPFQAFHNLTPTWCNAS